MGDVVLPYGLNRAGDAGERVGEKETRVYQVAGDYVDCFSGFDIELACWLSFPTNFGVDVEADRFYTCWWVRTSADAEKVEQWAVELGCKCLCGRAAETLFLRSMEALFDHEADFPGVNRSYI